MVLLLYLVSQMAHFWEFRIAREDLEHVGGPGVVREDVVWTILVLDNGQFAVESLLQSINSVFLRVARKNKPLHGLHSLELQMEPLIALNGTKKRTFVRTHKNIKLMSCT